jgi:hypothetical protein
MVWLRIQQEKYMVSAQTLALCDEVLVSSQPLASRD